MRFSIVFVLMLTACAPAPPSQALLVSVEVVDGRSPGGIDVIATEYALGEPYVRYSVSMVDNPSGVTADTCDEALASAAEYARRTGSESAAECEPVERQDRIVAATYEATTDRDGFVSLDLPVGTYEFYAQVEIVVGDDGCHFVGSATANHDVGELALMIDSNTCE